MKGLTRREFLKGTLVSAAGMAAVSSISPMRNVMGANDEVRIGVVGFRGKGSQHIKIFHEMENVRVVALCDADQAIIEREAQKFVDRQESVDTYTDVRKLLEDKSIDAVVTATPNHWHALVTVWACQAGKDVYVEKPVSHDIWEGRQMVAAARKYNRMVQSGTQRRSDPGQQEIHEYLREGQLGDIQYAHCLYFAHRDPIGRVSGLQPIPGSVDYNLWTGAAPLRALGRENLHYDWHWSWATGNGDLGNNGIHFLDLARWHLGYDEVSPRTMSIGGRFKWIDDGETPNTQITFYDYEPAPILFEMRNMPSAPGSTVMDNYKGIRVGMVIQCEDGYIAGGGAYDNDGNRIKQFALEGGGGHQANFIQAIRSRDREDLNAEVLNGHLSTALCHQGNISQRVGTVSDPATIERTVSEKPVYADSFRRFRQHLEAHDIDLETTQATIGPWIESNSSGTQLSADDSLTAQMANALYKRDWYRKPFEIPELA